MCLVHVLTQGKKKNVCQLGLFTNFDIFSKGFFLEHLGPEVFSAVKGTLKIGKKISKIKKYLKHFKNIANIIVQYKGMAQCFCSTIIRTALLKKCYSIAHTFTPVILNNNDYFSCFLVHLWGVS